MPSALTGFSIRGETHVGMGKPRFGTVQEVPEQVSIAAQPRYTDRQRLYQFGWKIRRSVEQVIDVVKWVMLVMAGLVAFMPVPERMRAYIENLFLKGPIKSSKLSSQQDPKLRASIQDVHFTMGEFGPELQKTRLGFNPKTDNSRLHGWFIQGQPDKSCVIYSYGRGSNVSHHESLLKSWMDRGYGILIYDYPNFGASEGKATEKSLYKSGVAACLYAQKHLGIDVENQVLMGNSLGSGVTANMLEHLKAMGLKPKAAVLVSSFPSVRTAFVFNRNKFSLGWGWLAGLLGKLFNENRISLQFSVEEALRKNTEVPILLLQGVRDKRTPPSMIQGMVNRLWNARAQAQIQTIWVPGVQHCLKQKDFPPLVEEADRFLQSLDRPPSPWEKTA